MDKADRITIHYPNGTTQEMVPAAVSPPAPPPPPKQTTSKGVTLWDDNHVEDLIFDVHGKEGIAAILVRGKNCRATNIESTGTAIVLAFNGAKDFVGENIVYTNALLNDKAVYSGGATSDGITIRNFRFFIDAPEDATDAAKWAAAEHGMRFHGWRNVKLINGFVDYRNNSYRAAALTVHEPGDSMLVDNSKFYGPVGIDNLAANVNKPELATALTANVHFNGCEIYTPNFFRCGAGAVGVEVRNSLIRAVKWPVGRGEYDLTPSGTVLDLKGGSGPWPASSGAFIKTRFEGTTLFAWVNPSDWRFEECTFANGQRTWTLGPHGELL